MGHMDMNYCAVIKESHFHSTILFWIVKVKVLYYANENTDGNSGIMFWLDGGPIKSVPDLLSEWANRWFVQKLNFLIGSPPIASIIIWGHYVLRPSTLSLDFSKVSNPLKFFLPQSPRCLLLAVSPGSPMEGMLGLHKKKRGFDLLYMKSVMILCYV